MGSESHTGRRGVGCTDRKVIVAYGRDEYNENGD